MLKKIKGDRHQNRARSPTATRFQATSRRPRARAGGRDARSRVQISGTPRDRARDGGRATRASGRVRSGRAPVPQLLGAASPRGPGRAAAEAGHRGPGCVRGAAPARRPPPRRTPRSQASGAVHARVAGRRCGRHSPGSRGSGARRRSSAREGPGGRRRSASQQPFVRLRDDHRRDAVISVIQTARQWRGRTAGTRLLPPPPGAAGTAAHAHAHSHLPGDAPAPTWVCLVSHGARL